MLVLTPQSKHAGQLSFFIKYIYLLLKVCLFGRQTLLIVLKRRKKYIKELEYRKMQQKDISSLTVQQTAPSCNLDMSFFAFLYCTRPSKWKATFPLSVNLSHWIGKTASILYSSLVVFIFDFISEAVIFLTRAEQIIRPNGCAD